MDPEDAVSAYSPFYEFTIKLLELLHHSRKPSVVEKSPLRLNDQCKVRDLSEQAFSHWKKAEIDIAILKFEQYEREFVSQTIRRDTAYAYQLQQLLSTGTSILSVRGSLHSQTLPQLLQTRAIEFEAVIFKAPYVLSKQEEVVMKILGDSLAKEDIILCLIQQDLEGQNHDYQTKLKVKEKLSTMTSNDISGYIEAKRTSETKAC
jgi:hypothetical protein